MLPLAFLGGAIFGAIVCGLIEFVTHRNNSGHLEVVARDGNCIFKFDNIKILNKEENKRIVVDFLNDVVEEVSNSHK